MAHTENHRVDTYGILSRAAALELLNSVLIRGRPLDEARDKSFHRYRLSGADRAFAHNLVATTLRRLGQIDQVLATCLSRSLGDTPPSTLNLLRLGVSQLLFLSTPAHAAVSTSVALAGDVNAKASPALTNAVLRRVAREGPALRDLQTDPGINTPAWLWNRWNALYGTPVARAIAETHLAIPPLDLSAKADPEAVAATVGGQVLSTGSIRLNQPTAVETLPDFAAGTWWVQDAASALPVRFLGPVSGRHVVDLCAAPGGKTAQLAASGARVTAIDHSPSRMARLRENMARLRLKADTVVADATTWRPSEPVDAVIVDVPCSATGTIRRHPDIPWQKTHEQLCALVPIQDRLLQAAIAMTKPGGIIVYSACSLEPEEGQMRIAALLASAAPVRRFPIQAAGIGGWQELLSTDGDLRTLPCHLADLGGLDGFYAARLLRT